MLSKAVFFGSFAAFAAGQSARPMEPTELVPMLGPSFASNFDPTDSEPIRAAREAFPGLVENQFAAGALDSAGLVFAIDVFSAATNESLYQYFHVGEGQEPTLTSGELNDQTIARIGSVSKLYTGYALLVHGGREIFDHPVTRYLPELASNQSSNAFQRIRWEDITVGALVSHQAGVGGATGILYEAGNEAINLTQAEYLEWMRDRKIAVTSPFRTALYSDGGYGILTAVIERLTGQTYDDAMQDIIGAPLGLDGFSASAPTGPDLNAINTQPILNEQSSWAQDVPVVAGSGGLYANAASLRATGLSILNSELLSDAVTQWWMKPMSGTGSLTELVGAPWEISRLAIPVTPGSNRTRISDLYAKAGGNGEYGAVLALSPDHGIGYSIIVVGATAGQARFGLRDLVGEAFIPAAEAAAAENAQRNLAGTFVSADSEGTNITLTVDNDLPGIGVESLFIDGVDSLWALYRQTTPESRADFLMRMYPVGINDFSTSLASLYKTNGTMQLAHRGISSAVQLLVDRPAAEGGQGGLFDGQFSWMNIDFAFPIDEFIFELVDGRLESVSISYRYDANLEFATSQVFHRVECN